jgi:hypothetical protein
MVGYGGLRTESEPIMGSRLTNTSHRFDKSLSFDEKARMASYGGLCTESETQRRCMGSRIFFVDALSWAWWLKKKTTILTTAGESPAGSARSHQDCKFFHTYIHMPCTPSLSLECRYQLLLSDRMMDGRSTAGVASTPSHTIATASNSHFTSPHIQQDHPGMPTTPSSRSPTCPPTLHLINVNSAIAFFANIPDILRQDAFDRQLPSSPTAIFAYHHHSSRLPSPKTALRLPVTERLAHTRRNARTDKHTNRLVYVYNTPSECTTLFKSAHAQCGRGRGSEETMARTWTSAQDKDKRGCSGNLNTLAI